MDFRASSNPGDAATPLDFWAYILAVTNRIFHNALRLFDLPVHVASEAKEGISAAIFCPARGEEHGDGESLGLYLTATAPLVLARILPRFTPLPLRLGPPQTRL